ncbi:hypothetical protein F4777DRAFT_173215 [Nemania sp. FL0916]|nr:hypothetical protein F4777DRAFT_173215 [Nemania sp. FL0916]
MSGFDVESLLQNGYWPNSRAKSPVPRNVADVPLRSSHPPRDDQATPRRVPYHISIRRPPPPSVEDESDALAKEAGSVVSSLTSEEPPNRGERDQWPLLVPVDEYLHELNPERRFVLVSNPSDSSSDASVSETQRKPRGRSTAPSAKPDPEPVSYEANTGRKYALSFDREDKTGKKQDIRPDAEHRRNRPVDLPPIITTGGESEKRDGTQQSKSPATDRRREDYLSPRRLSSASSRAPREHLLSPEIIEHATNGRDKPYHRGRPNSDSQARDRSAPLANQYDRGTSNGGKHNQRESRSAHSHSPTLHKRRPSEVPKYTRHASKDSTGSSRHFAEGSSSRSDRKGPSSPHHQSRRESSSKHPNTEASRAPPPYNDAFYSSEDEHQPRADHRGSRSGMPTEKTEYLTMPDEPRGVGRRKSVKQSPSHSPQNFLSAPYSNSSNSRSATFPRESTSSLEGDHGGRTPPHISRAGVPPSVTQSPVPVAGAATARMTATPGSSESASYRRSPVVPPPTLPRVGTNIDPRAQPPATAAPVATQTTWPPRFEPPPTAASSNPPITSYRRYSAELKVNELPDISHCPRVRPEAGHVDWLTLPRCDNFNICPSCYSFNFASTEFAHEFVPMPFRRFDQPLACDFGASEFYRIAWLFTRKYRRPDLGLLHSLTLTTAQDQPCTGHLEVSRIWYSIRDPKTKQLINDFKVCRACTTTVETLLPSLFGLFVPFDSPAERTRGVCAMHHDRGHDRSRFVLYFDALEGTADRALVTRSAPDVQWLANRIRELAAIPPCREGRVVPQGYWHTMRDVPGILVCNECFIMVVQPLLEGNDGLKVAGQFHHHPQPLKNQQCMLFSDRMRNVFRRAVARRDIPYLQAKVNERNEKKEECDARLKAVQRRESGTPRAEAETERIIKEWKKYE